MQSMILCTTTPPTAIPTLSLHDALTIWAGGREPDLEALANRFAELGYIDDAAYALAQSRSRSEEHTSELQSPVRLVWRVLLDKQNLSNVTPAERYRLSGRGKGGLIGLVE